MTAPHPNSDEGAALRAICAALKLPADETQIARMLDYLALLQRWNTVYNLTAVREPQAMLTQHVADCLAAVAAIATFNQQVEVGQTQPMRVLDVGSGGGLPGVLIALFNADAQVTCVDAVAKKAAFIKQVAGALPLPHLHAEHGRVEQLGSGPYDLITARAFASLSQLVSLSERLLAPEGCWMAMKGRMPQAEIAELPATIEVFHVEPLVVPGLDAERCLVWMRRARDTEPSAS